MKEVVVLRDKPELKISLNEAGIEIIDASQTKNCGFLLFNNILSIEINQKKTDWIISTLSWVVDFFAGGLGANYKNNANLKLKTVNQTLKIWLDNVDFNEAERITKLITSKTSNNLL
ncbi:hypothetical protein [Algibacter sp.]|uniref:hypothetical protein n=1 Tax=Algibacter sp. TaxID=1872428 RepID=UPI003C76310A